MRASPEGGARAVAAAGMTLADMRVEPSGDGQYLLIYFRRRIVAMWGPMGSDVEVFEFTDVGRITAMELIGRL